jgi:hypothetical protein
MYYIEVVDRTTKQPVRRIVGGDFPRFVERTEAAISLTLDHKRYYTRVVGESAKSALLNRLPNSPLC